MYEFTEFLLKMAVSGNSGENITKGIKFICDELLNGKFWTEEERSYR